MNFEQTTRILKTLAPIILGCAIGIALTSAWLLSAEVTLSAGVTVGVVSGTLAFLIFLIARTAILRATRKRTAANDSNASFHLYSIVKQVLPDSAETEQNAQKIVELLQRTVQAGISYWSAAIAVGFGITAVGAAIAMVTALAAIRQVERLDAQNRLIEEQIEQALAARVSATFAAQLPGLLEQIYEEKSQDEIWTLSSQLLSRIQTVVNLATPYTTDPLATELLKNFRTELPQTASSPSREATYVEEFLAGFPDNFVYSVERGQLLQLLVASGMDFRNETDQPILDFSRSYLRKADLFYGNSSDERYSLGNLDLRLSNLYELETNIDFTGVYLGGAILPAAETLGFGPFVTELEPGNPDFDGRFIGADLTFSIVPSNLIGLIEQVTEDQDTWVLPPRQSSDRPTVDCNLGAFSSLSPFLEFNGYLSNDPASAPELEQSVLFHYHKLLRADTACGPSAFLLSDLYGTVLNH